MTEPGIVHPQLADSVSDFLRIDTITVTRSNTTVDAEGVPVPGGTVVLEKYGTFAAVSAQEQLVAQERGTTIDKALNVELGVDLHEGDLVSDANGVAYEVITAEDRRLERRLLLRKR